MVESLFKALDVDLRQWFALTGIFIKKEIRQSSVSVFRSKNTGNRSFYALLFFYFLTGLVFVPITVSNPNLFMPITLLITYTMFMIGSLILVEYHNIILAPEDYVILAHKPISSRTFYFVKLSCLIFYVMLFSCILSVPSFVALIFSGEVELFLIFMAFVGLIFANATVSLAIVLMYTFILSKVSFNRMQNILAFFQIGLAFLVYSSFFILPKIMEISTVFNLTLMDMPFLVLLPATWFSSYVMIASANANLIYWLLALLSLCVFIVLIIFTVSKLSLNYAEKLISLSSYKIQRKKIKSRFDRIFYFFATAHEERVVARLIINQFLYDNKFKLAVLGILPLTMFYLFRGIQDGALADPFVTYKVDLGKTGLLYLLIFLFPMMLRTYVTQSDNYQASWVFYVTPTKFWRLIYAEKNFLMVFFVLPFLFLLGIIFYYYFQNFLHVLLHIFFLGILAHLFLQFAFLYSPDLPFSRPNIRGQRSRHLALLLLLVPFLLYFSLPLIFQYIYPVAFNYAMLMIMLLGVTVVLENLIKVRVKIHLGRTEFPA